MTTWGIDYTFDATGNTDVMRAALEVCCYKRIGMYCYMTLTTFQAHVIYNVCSIHSRRTEAGVSLA